MEGDPGAEDVQRHPKGGDKMIKHLAMFDPIKSSGARNLMVLLTIMFTPIFGWMLLHESKEACIAAGQIAAVLYFCFACCWTMGDPDPKPEKAHA